MQIMFNGIPSTPVEDACGIIDIHPIGRSSFVSNRAPADDNNLTECCYVCSQFVFLKCSAE